MELRLSWRGWGPGKAGRLRTGKGMTRKTIRLLVMGEARGGRRSAHHMTPVWPIRAPHERERWKRQDRVAVCGPRPLSGGEMTRESPSRGYEAEMLCPIPMAPGESRRIGGPAPGEVSGVVPQAAGGVAPSPAGVCEWQVARDDLAPRAAREWVRQALVSWGLSGAADDLLLLCSELVTNAVVHGAAERIRACLSYGGGVLLLAVEDGSPGRARGGGGGPGAGGGRGRGGAAGVGAGGGGRGRGRGGELAMSCRFFFF